MKPKLNYNERSWAIDVIGYIKTYTNKKNKLIQDAGGEQTVNTEGGSLFPDVLLFGDKQSAKILQGWELKMPDTPINDSDFIENAEKKAKILGLDSFLLWNVSYAHLYIFDETTKEFSLRKEWDDLHNIMKRRDVKHNKNEWQKLVEKIIDDLNDLFENKSISGKRFIEAYRSGGITSFILDNSTNLSELLESKAKREPKFRAQITLWGMKHKSEYGEKQNDSDVLSKIILSNWIGKFLFAHILNGFDSRAKLVYDINDKTSPEQALKIFENISLNCNFWTIFSDVLGLGLVPKSSWNHILQFNNLLKDLKIASIEQKQLSDILETTVHVSIRKLRGQYPTPLPLARLLVSLSINNTETDRILDPCSGSGTIIRAALEEKLNNNIDENTISKTIYASDQDHQANQITTFAMTKPELINLPIRIFNQDVFSLDSNLYVKFRDPKDGKEFSEKLDNFDVIVSNLPFISQTGRDQYKSAIKNVNNILSYHHLNLSKKSDISAYIPFTLYDLINQNGTLGIIISNSWLGTDWGDEFYNALTKFYHLKSVITSGAGRWFQNSEVVTNILILEKVELQDNLETDFIVLKRPLSDIDDLESLNILSSQIRLGTLHDSESLTIHSTTLNKIKKFKKYGLRGTMQFLECDWILNLPLKSLTTFVEIYRGERRGWNQMFYPSQSHSIEKKFLKPLLKNSKDITGYIANADKKAFCCSEELDVLESNYPGTYSWIKKFESAKNNSNQPLVQSLARANMHWYEMRDDKLANFVFSINSHKRLFISKFKEPSFADQRLVCLVVKEQYYEDIDLIHAILNSSITYLFIEGMFFGKGLGALDLNQTRFKNYMHILNIEILSQEQKTEIKSLFSIIQNRDVEDIFDELEMTDRIDFDQCIIRSFGLNVSLDKIYKDLITLVNLRLTALDKFD
jgi:tRNA1(Val) A37 N6-methylase TrmN6